MEPPTNRSIDRAALVIGHGGVVVIGGPLMIWISGWTGPGNPSAAIDTAWVLLTSGPLAMAWLLAAMGLGWPLRAAFAREARKGFAIQIGLGVAALLVLDEALGTLGWLQWGGAIGAWTLIVAGILLLGVQTAIHPRTRTISPSHPLTHSPLHPLTPSPPHFLAAPSWLVWTAAPAIAVLLVAACSAPGWLWATEFGGYDALSYHLQLPREWLALGRIEPLRHNVYSFLPGYMEAAYYHLAVLRGDGIKSVYASQLLHAGMTLMTAFMVGKLAARLGGEGGGGKAVGTAAAVLFLATPWVIVVGSLGYNEMGALLMLATGMLVLAQEPMQPWKCGAMVGVLAAAACGAKLTALGMVAAPLAVLLLMNVSPKKWLTALAAACAAGVIVLLPFFIRNQIYAGNPVFPFATGLFGLGHWSPEQPVIWARGHVSDAGLGARFAGLWNQFLSYGVGPNPDPGTPWKWQWSVLPFLTLLAPIVLGWIFIVRGPLNTANGEQRSRRTLGRWSFMLAVVLLIQIAFWMSFTHLKSRFLLPAAIPVSIIVALGAAAAAAAVTKPHKASWQVWTSVVIALLALAIQPLLIFRSERDEAPAAAIGRLADFTGDGLTASEQRELGETTFPSIAINHLLPEGSKVLLIGEATPLYYRLDRITYQTTWDRGPLSHLMRELPDDPARWAQALRANDFTHLLVNETMLAIWDKDGWGDPLLTRPRVHDFAEQTCDAVYRYPGGVTLYRLR